MSEVLHELRLSPWSARLIAAATALWSIVLLAIVVNGGSSSPALLTALIAVPLVVFGDLAIADRSPRLIRLGAGWIAFLGGALLVGEVVQASPIVGVVPLAIAIGAAACSRFPAGATITAFALSGFGGTMKAFTGVSSALLIDLILAGLLVGVILRHLSTPRERALPVWPALIVVGLYVAVTVFQVIAAPKVGSALLSFRLSIFYLLALFVLAYAPWERSTYVRIARGVVIAAGLVGAYAVMRWFIGPSPRETAIAIQSAGAYNFVGGQLRVFGSFASGHELGFWAGAIAPLCLAAALYWKGRWRAVAGAAFMLLVAAELACRVRGSFVGLVLGVVLVLVLYQLARSVPGLHLGRTLAIGATSVAVLGGALAFTVASTGGLDRYTNILHPSKDAGFADRQQKWDDAVGEIGKHPFGVGFGAGSANPEIRGPYLSIASFNLDNSYLKVAFEQGIPVLVLFVAALVLLLLRICLGAIRAADPQAAAMSIGAAGALVSMMATMYTGLYIEDTIVLGPWVAVGLGTAFLLREEAARSAAGVAEPPKPRAEPAPST